MRVGRFHLIASLLLVVAGFQAYPQSAAPELGEMEERLARFAKTGLPDFAPAAFRSARAAVRELQITAVEKGSVPEEDLRRVQQDLDEFQSLAIRTRDSIGRAYPLRNAALQADFVRASNPARFARAEEDYRAARSLAEERRFAEARQLAARAARQYDAIIRNATAQVKQRLSATLERYQEAIRADVKALAADAGDPGNVAGIESVARRVSPRNHGFDINGNGLFDYEPPLPPPPGPVPPSFAVQDRGVDSIRLWWADLSDNETGSRIVRTTDLFTWETVRVLPPIARLTETRHTDANLQPDRRYCYAVETFNALGTRRSETRCTYTRPADDSPVWRVELRVKVADIANAGTDATPVITIGDDGLHPGVATYMDYGRDDFQRGSIASYDLNLGHIRRLGDIVSVVVGNDDVDDVMLVEELTLLVNQRVVFNQYYGAAAGSVRPLGALRVEHAELLASPDWQAYVQASKSDRTFNLAPLVIADGGPIKVQVERAQIVSRIEGIVGHTLHDQLRGHLRWGFLHGPAVEVGQIRSSAIHVDLDTEATVDWVPNPEVDIDFDLVVTKRCEPGKLILDLTTQNVVTDAGFAWWKDLLSLGVLPAGLAIFDACSSTPAPPSIQQTVEVPLPDGVDCAALDARFDTAANLEICCFSLGMLRAR